MFSNEELLKQLREGKIREKSPPALDEVILSSAPLWRNQQAQAGKKPVILVITPYLATAVAIILIVAVSLMGKPRAGENFITTNTNGDAEWMNRLANCRYLGRDLRSQNGKYRVSEAGKESYIQNGETFLGMKVLDANRFCLTLEKADGKKMLLYNSER